MSNLAIGSAISTSSQHKTGKDKGIYAHETPRMAPRVAGQTLLTMPGYETFLSPGNYHTALPSATIAAVVPIFVGVEDAETRLTSGVKVSLSLSVSDTKGNTALFSAGSVVIAEAVLSAALRPSMSVLKAGQSLVAMAGFAEMTALANFTSNAAGIESLDVAVTGDATTVSEELQAGQIVGFVVTATDALGNTARFDAGTTKVEPTTPWQLAGSVIQAHPLAPVSPTISGTLIY